MKTPERGADPVHQDRHRDQIDHQVQHTYGWLGKFPSLRKWVGDRVIESMKTHGYQIVNEDFEATVAVDRNDIADDELGIYAPCSPRWGARPGYIPTSSVSASWAPVSPPCYDAQYFFDTDRRSIPQGRWHRHPGAGCQPGGGWRLYRRALVPARYQPRPQAGDHLPGSQVPELIAMTKIDDEAVFTRKGVPLQGGLPRCRRLRLLAAGVRQQAGADPDNLWDAFSRMREFQADGRKLGIKPTLLVVPASLEKLATQMLERELSELQQRAQGQAGTGGG